MKDELIINDNSTKAFNKLKEIQLLLKKESALKEICKINIIVFYFLIKYLVIKSRNDITSQIEKECLEIYQKKISFKNEVIKRMELKEQKFLLIDKQKEVSKEFKSTWTYVRNLLEFLWDEPYIIYQILSNATIEDVQNHLAPFFANNFYENILSSNYIEENLMYIISLLLKQEIKNLSNSNNPENFLENTPCGIFLTQLCEKKDIKSFCKMIILNVVENLEWTFSSKEINFDFESVHNYLLKEKEELNKNNNKKINRSNLFKKNKTEQVLDNNNVSRISLISNLPIEKEILNEKKNEENLILFNSKYLPDITNKELNEKLTTYEKENNINMTDYIRYQIEKSEINNNKINNNNKDNTIAYGNTSFINNIFHFELSQDLFSIYVISFLKTIETINLLFKNLISYSHLVPISIKYICKIINILIKKQFPNINKVEEYAFMSRFFFNKILLPIFENPTFGALINEYIISKGTINNIKNISNIVSYLCLGRFYSSDFENGNYTLFNRFFMERMPDVFTFFEEITDVTLPENIENIIQDKIQDDFQPSFFRDNPDEVFFHRSILFSFDDFYTLIDNMKKCKDLLFAKDNKKKLEETFNQIISNYNMKILNEIKNNISYENIPDSNSKKKGKINEDHIEIKKLFMINQLLINEKYSYILDINQEKPNFNIKELKKIKTEEEITKNNVVKAKNLISAILYNYCKLNKKDYKTDKIKDSVSIFEELRKFTQSSNFVIDGTIPCEWYLDTFLETIHKIPQEYSKDDYELLYKELKEDIIKSINSLNFDILSNLYENIKFAKKRKNLYNEEEKTLNDIYLNDKVQYIIEYTKIPCELYFCYNSKEKAMSIKQMKKEDISLQFLDTMTIKEPKKGLKTCKTIKSFTSKFPNIIGSALFYEENSKIFEMLKQLKIPKTVEDYLKIVKNNLIKLKIWSTEEEFININNKIYDYVTEKIYDKIYPLIPSLKDVKIYNNCLKLSWTEPKHYIKDKTNYSFESFLPDVIKYFKEFDKEKSPRKKINLMKEIFNCIDNIEELNGENAKKEGIETQYSILTYAFVKATPNNIDTNCNYLELFIEKDGEEDSLLTQIKVICNNINEIGYDKLNGVTKEEFDSKFELEEEKNVNYILKSINTIN